MKMYYIEDVTCVIISKTFSLNKYLISLNEKLNIIERILICRMHYLSIYDEKPLKDPTEEFLFC